jgi:hypothetical protein
MNREVHVRVWERAEVKFLRATRQNPTAPLEHPDLLGAPVGALLPWPVVAGSDVVALASIAMLI